MEPCLLQTLKCLQCQYLKAPGHLQLITIVILFDSTHNGPHAAADISHAGNALQRCRHLRGAAAAALPKSTETGLAESVIALAGTHHAATSKCGRLYRQC